jgi:hypothetical protein
MEEAIQWLLDDLAIGVSPAEILWMLSNIVGVLLSIVAATLAVSDRSRVRRGDMSARYEDTRGRLRRERNGIIVLGDVSAKCEITKAFIHFGHGICGMLVTVTPNPIRYQLSVAIGFVTLWFLLSSFLLMQMTIMTLKGRYDYRYERRHGRRASWKETATGLIRDARADFGDGLLIMRRRITG